MVIIICHFIWIKKKIEHGWFVFEPSGNMHHSNWCFILYCLLGLTCNQVCYRMHVRVYPYILGLVHYPRWCPILFSFPGSSCHSPGTPGHCPQQQKGSSPVEWTRANTHTKSLNCNQWFFYFFSRSCFDCFHLLEKDAEIDKRGCDDSQHLWLLRQALRPQDHSL